jgi:hypothetical protein
MSASAFALSLRPTLLQFPKYTHAVYLANCP